MTVIKCILKQISLKCLLLWISNLLRKYFRKHCKTGWCDGCIDSSSFSFVLTSLFLPAPKLVYSQLRVDLAKVGSVLFVCPLTFCLLYHLRQFKFSWASYHIRFQEKSLRRYLELCTFAISVSIQTEELNAKSGKCLCMISSVNSFSLYFMCVPSVYRARAQPGFVSTFGPITVLPRQTNQL